MTTIVYRADGHPDELGAELGRGGEGAVYTVRGNDLDCAKLYHKPLAPDTARKLHLMVENPPHDPAFDTLKHRSIAWPSATLFADRGHATCVGFMMPRVDMRAFKKALAYFNAVDRNRLWGCSFTWKHLYTAAFNLASAVAAIHERGYCVGDLNESNTLIAFNTLVTIIDCDSFQVPDLAAGTVYRCPVGKGEYTAPELQGKAYRDVDRTLETDRFALAVFLFQLLMDGTHPYQARGPLVDDAPTTEAKIVRGHFPYARRPGVEPPQFALPYDLLPAELQRLFERTFVSGHRDPRMRASAADWFDTLIRLRSQFVQCRSRGTHVYLSHRATCPWCELEQSTGKDLFPTPFGQQIPMEDATVTLETVERRLEYLRSYVTIALADGVLNPEEQSYLTALGARLQLSPPDVDRIVRQELGKQRARVVRPAPMTTSPPSPAGAKGATAAFADFQQKATYLGVVVGTLGGFLVNAASPASANGVMATVCALLALAGGAVVVARAHRSPVGAVVGSLGTVVLFGLLGRSAPVVLAPPSWGVVFGTLLFFRARRLHALYQTSPLRAFQAAAGEALAVGFVIVLVGGLAATAVSPEGFALRPIEREPLPFRAPVLPPPLPVERPDSAALGDLRRGLDAGKALFERGRYRDASTAFRGVDRDWRPLAARYPDDLELKQIGAEDRRWQKKVHDACEAEREVALRRGAEPPTCT